jgi:uncharacterized membrane protein
MTEPRSTWTDQQVETVVGNLLRAGVLLAALVTLTGGACYLVQHGGEPIPDYRVFDPARGQIGGLLETVSQAFRGQSRALIMLGVMLLIATPVARVVFSVFAFAVQRDRTYIMVTLIVLSILMYSFLTGLFGA